MKKCLLLLLSLSLCLSLYPVTRIHGDTQDNNENITIYKDKNFAISSEGFAYIEENGNLYANATMPHHTSGDYRYEMEYPFNVNDNGFDEKSQKFKNTVLLDTNVKSVAFMGDIVVQ